MRRLSTGLRLVGMTGLVLLAGCDALDSDVSVRYEIESSATQVLVTYRTEAGFDSQRVVQPPFAYEGEYQEGRSLGIGIQSLDAVAREVGCRILVDDTEIDNDSDAGVSASAVCSGIAE